MITKNYKNPFSLTNKNAVILGGNGLIGKDICALFTKSSCNVHNLDINSSVKNKINYNFHYFDLKDSDNLEYNFHEILKKIKKIDIFVNCSFPITEDWGINNFDQVKLKSFRKNINYQLINSSWIIKKIADYMKANKKKGSIINLGSIYGFLGQDLSIYKNTNMRENFTYALVKGGVINSTRQFASYYGKYNIRINTISPGGILGHVKGSSNKQNKKFISNYSSKTPLKRLCKSSEVAPAVQFLASDASSYITGINLIIDGGWSII